MQDASKSYLPITIVVVMIATAITLGMKLGTIEFRQTTHEERISAVENSLDGYNVIKYRLDDIDEKLDKLIQSKE